VSGSWIRAGRQQRGWTQAALGEKVGAHQAQVSQWETGKAEPSKDQLARLHELFGDGGGQARDVESAAGKTASRKSSEVQQLSLLSEDVPEPEPAEGRPARPSEPGRKVQAGRAAGKGNGSANGVSLGFEARLWQAADVLRGNMDPSEYKHVVLGLLFLKYISDAFEERREQLRQAIADPEDEYYVEDPEERAEELAMLVEDRDEYAGENVFWVPEQARWSAVQAQAKQPEIGKLLDDAMDAIERENASLKGALPKIYALPSLDKQGLGKLIDLVSGIGLGTEEHRAKDTLGRVYEYFLSRFASAEGKGGGEL
jgi:transcriptional regulator with XRE-family HTH domain